MNNSLSFMLFERSWPPISVEFPKHQDGIKDWRHNVQKVSASKIETYFYFSFNRSKYSYSLLKVTVCIAMFLSCIIVILLFALVSFMT